MRTADISNLTIFISPSTRLVAFLDLLRWSGAPLALGARIERFFETLKTAHQATQFGLLDIDRGVAMRENDVELLHRVVCRVPLIELYADVSDSEIHAASRLAHSGGM
jgi:hypothetical protein